MNVGKKLRKFIFLNVFAMMGMSCYILADTFFISVANGTLGIAALNLTLPVYGLLFAIGSLIGIGSATRYSLCKMTDNETSKLYFSNALMFAVLIGIGFTLLHRLGDLLRALDAFFAPLNVSHGCQERSTSSLYLLECFLEFRNCLLQSVL